MARLYRKKLVLAKIEATYGTDPTPTTTANCMLTSDLTIQTMQGDTVSRNTDRPTLGGEISYHVAPHTTMSFMCEVAGAGTAGTVPKYGPLLRACGMSELATPTGTPTSVEYEPVSSSFESVTCYYHQDGILHESNGVRGNVRLILTPGGIPHFAFELTGLRVAPVATGDPALTTTGWQVPLAVTNTNTTTFTLHGYSGNLIACELDLGNQVVYRNVVGEESVQIVDRGTIGTITIEEPALGTKDYHAIVAAHTTGALQIVHGTTAGNIVQIDAANVQLLQPTIGETDGIATLQFQLSLVPTAAGDDEIKITVK